jgi:hypothetical protein
VLALHSRQQAVGNLGTVLLPTVHLSLHTHTLAAGGVLRVSAQRAQRVCV